MDAPSIPGQRQLDIGTISGRRRPRARREPELRRHRETATSPQRIGARRALWKEPGWLLKRNGSALRDSARSLGEARSETEGKGGVGVCADLEECFQSIPLPHMPTSCSRSLSSRDFRRGFGRSSRRWKSSTGIGRDVPGGSHPGSPCLSELIAKLESPARLST